MKKIKLVDLAKNICGIYKLTFPNGKIYIGQSIDIKRRIAEHNSLSTAKTPCDRAINKYGKITEIEILEIFEEATKLDLNEAEIYWIGYYKSNDRNIGYNLTIGGDSKDNIGEKSSKAVFTNEQVLDIRKRRYLGERKKDVYKDYQEFSFSTFEHVWLGRGYLDVGKEFIIPKGAKTIQQYGHEANSGLNNGRTKFTKEQILDIREKYDNGATIAFIWHNYYPTFARNTIARVAYRQTFKDI